MRKLVSLVLTVGMGLGALNAHAGLVLDTFNGGDPGDTLGGFAMTDFGDDERSDGSSVTHVDSPLDGQVDFVYQNQSAADMTLETVNWWEYDHGSVYTTETNWIELILPENTRAFSFYVGASFYGGGWLQAFDNLGNDVYSTFSVSPSNSPGFGVYSSTECGSISRIIVDPTSWGVGNFAINQDACSTEVPAPGPIGMLIFGLAGLAVNRLRRQRGVVPA